ncbi:MAG TPA: phosphoribosylformylglycinamidine synthase subunit PurQ [Alloiococcus sp.]|nr:phosphoribosylformylglycinamidine synthase subunit PurQ [Alloiococcus sp.]
MKVAVLSFPGTLAANQVLKLIETVGYQGEIIPSTQDELDGFDAVIIPDGNAYGNAVRPGAIAQFDAVLPALKVFNKEGKIIIGIGNGFHILTEANLLPGNLTLNESLKQVNQEVAIALNETIFSSERVSLSFANKYGRYVINPDKLKQLIDQNQILMTYIKNINGSVENIAGVMNEQKNVFGMMVLPERHIDEAISTTAGIELIVELLKRSEASE